MNEADKKKLIDYLERKYKTSDKWIKDISLKPRDEWTEKQYYKVVGKVSLLYCLIKHIKKGRFDKTQKGETRK